MVDAAAMSGALEDLEGGPAAVVGQEEVTGIGDPAPGVADGATIEKGFRRQTYDDLPGENLLQKATKAKHPFPLELKVHEYF